MAFKNVGTYNLDKAVSGSAGAANAGAFTMDARSDTAHKLHIRKRYPDPCWRRLGRVCFRDAGGLRHHWRLRG